jgi:4-amino-4-deoxy-L-arabinose transferase-like glycosyltransferase
MKPSTSSRSSLSRAVSIFVVAFVIRLIYIFVILDRSGIPGSLHVPNGDGGQYDQIAWSIAQGKGFSLPKMDLRMLYGLEDNQIYFGEKVIALKRRMSRGYENLTMSVGEPTNFFPPLYPMFLAFIYKVFGRDFALVQIFQALLDSFAALLLFIIGKRLFPVKAAYLGAILYAIYPWSLECARAFLTEALLIPIIAVIFYFIQKTIDDRRLRYAAFAGFAIGLAYETRMLTAVLLPICILWMLISHRRFALKNIAILLLSFFLVIVPWTIRNKLVFDRWWCSFTTVGHNALTTATLYVDNVTVRNIGQKLHLFDKINRLDLILPPPDVGSMTEPERFDLLRERSNAFIKANPGYFLSYAISQAGRCLIVRLNEYGYGWAFFISYYAMTLLAIIGIIYARRQLKRMGWIVMYLFLHPILVGLTLFIFVRMRWPLNPALALLAGPGLYFLCQEARKLAVRIKLTSFWGITSNSLRPS